MTFWNIDFELFLGVSPKTPLLDENPLEDRPWGRKPSLFEELWDENPEVFYYSSSQICPRRGFCIVEAYHITSGQFGDYSNQIGGFFDLL